MEAFFKQLHNVLSDYSTKISDTRISEILAAGEIFLKDIKNTNLRNDTICETASINYNIGKSVYYTDSVISAPEDETITSNTDNVFVKRGYQNASHGQWMNGALPSATARSDVRFTDLACCCL
ncbi:hypothetical protein CBL_09351 [Carabus blaptoides fortunei]